MAHFYVWSSTVSILPNQYEEILHFSMSFTGSTLEPPSGFEPGTPGLEIQFPEH